MFNFLDVARQVAGVAAQAVTKVPVLESKFHVKDRLDGPWPVGPYLWLHGASLGECRMLLNLATFLQEDLPACPKMLITTQKVEVLSFLQDAGKGKVDAALAPADTPAAMKNFVEKVQPLGLILAENELWPGYLSTMRSISTKPSVALVSGRYYRSLPGIDFSAVGFACMQTGADLSRLLSVVSKSAMSHMMIGGDWKLLPWVRSGKEVSAPENPTVDTAFISMHISEWVSLCRMIVSSIKRQESVVLVPRRLSEVSEFRKALQDQEIIVVEWPLVQKGAVSIVSQYGLTKDVFATSKSAVIGGSFGRGLGVHDFWEPLQMGVATCVGPFARGQKETVSALIREGVITQLQSTAGYSRRNMADTRLVGTFLAHERTKIEDSYHQLLEFLKKLLQKSEGVA